MGFNDNLIVATMNTAQSTEDDFYTSSEHSGDGDSAPWSVCSSTDMCTPMPHMTSHPINSKRSSTYSDHSLSSAAHFSTASSDHEAPHYLAKSNFPATPPTVPSSRPSASSGLVQPEAHDHLAPYARMSTWPGEVLAQPVNRSSHKIGPDAASSDQAPAYNPFNTWRPEPIARAPLHARDGVKQAFANGAGEHSRSASYHSTSSVDSWSNNMHGNFNQAFSPPNMPVCGVPQSNLSKLCKSPMAGMNMLHEVHNRSLNQANLSAAQASLQALNLHNSPQEARRLVDSLSSLNAPCAANPLAMGGPSLMDPQTLMAYNAAFGPSPLLYMYGASPDLLAARSAALAQLVNASAPSHFAGAPGTPADDEGSNSTGKKTNLYKTELCRSWEEKGTCRYGSKCQFAHGQDELKNVSRHPKFKTEICRTFWLHGSCPYGKRCCFLHTTSTEAGAPTAPNAQDQKQGMKSLPNAHDPPTSRLQKRVSGGPLTATSPSDQPLAAFSSSPPTTSPKMQSAPAARSSPDMSHSRSNSSSSCSISSDGSSHIDSLRIHIWPRFGAREQVPPQDAPGPRSRLQRLRPTEDYSDCSSSMPATSTLSTTRYSPFTERAQTPNSAFDSPSLLVRSSSHQISKARSANGAAEPHWPMSRLSPSSINRS